MYEQCSSKLLRHGYFPLCRQMPRHSRDHHIREFFLTPMVRLILSRSVDELLICSIVFWFGFTQLYFKRFKRTKKDEEKSHGNLWGFWEMGFFRVRNPKNLHHGCLQCSSWPHDASHSRLPAGLVKKCNAFLKTRSHSYHKTQTNS